MKKETVKVIAAILGILIFISFSEVVSAKKRGALKRLINKLNSNYIPINHELRKLADHIENFPHTTLTFSLKMHKKNIQLTSMEMWEDINQLAKHTYTTYENMILKAGGSQLFYQTEIKTGHHVLKTIFDWTGEDKIPIKGEANVQLSIKAGNNYFIQLYLEEGKKAEVELLYTVYVKKNT